MGLSERRHTENKQKISTEKKRLKDARKEEERLARVKGEGWSRRRLLILLMISVSFFQS